MILNPCPDASGSQIAIHSARKQGDVGIEGGNVGRVVEDAGRAADVEDGPPVAARGHVVGEEAGQGEDGVQCRTQRRGVILQNAPGGVGVVLTKVGVAYDHIDLELVLDDDGFVQLLSSGRSRRQVSGMRRDVDLILMLASQLGGKVVEGLLAPTDEDEVVPQRGVVVGEGQTRAGGRAEDQHDLTSVDAIVAGMSARRKGRFCWRDEGNVGWWAEIVVHARRVTDYGRRARMDVQCESGLSFLGDSIIQK